MKVKEFTIWMLGIVIAAPVILVLVGMAAVYHGTSVPGGIMEADRPLHSHMFLTPNYSVHHSRLKFSSGWSTAKYSTNSHGFRTPEFSSDKEIILLSGDSVLFGANLNDDETVPALLEKMFGGEYYFVNTGIMSKGIPHNLLTLKNFVELSKKENYRLRYFFNWMGGGDFEDSRSLEDIEKRAQKKNLSFKHRMMIRFPTLTAFAALLSKPERVAFTLNFIKYYFSEEKNYQFQPNSRGKVEEPVVDERFDMNLKYFKEMQEICRNNKITLVNFIYLSGYSDLINENSYSDKLGAILRKRGAKTIIKAKDIYLSQGKEFLPYIPSVANDFWHFSPIASQAIALHLYDYLSRDGLGQ